MEKSIIIYKEIGETPLEALEKFRSAMVSSGKVSYKDLPMTYAGRLDPMAEGELLILMGDECKLKEKYLGLDKQYEVQIVSGINTDTYDLLGIAQIGDTSIPSEALHKAASSFIPSKIPVTLFQKYPPFSSKTVNGKQLHSLARRGELPKNLPANIVQINSLEIVEQKEITIENLKKKIFSSISLVNGDFRQQEIMDRWGSIFNELEQQGIQALPVIAIRVKCSSGTYMRSLAHGIGSMCGSSAFALSIKRTKIFLKDHD